MPSRSPCTSCELCTTGAEVPQLHSQRCSPAQLTNSGQQVVMWQSRNWPRRRMWKSLSKQQHPSAKHQNLVEATHEIWLASFLDHLRLDHLLDRASMPHRCALGSHQTRALRDHRRPLRHLHLLRASFKAQVDRSFARDHPQSIGSRDAIDVLAVHGDDHVADLHSAGQLGRPGDMFASPSVHRVEANDSQGQIFAHSQADQFVVHGDLILGARTEVLQRCSQTRVLDIVLRIRDRGHRDRTVFPKLERQVLPDLPDAECVLSESDLTISDTGRGCRVAYQRHKGENHGILGSLARHLDAATVEKAAAHGQIPSGLI
mmetsp:Transcript_169095/g.543493  ORF Transcript_169095/g.543493 Transcript_169095/m.543493 type:complete len:317 (+) Transcript_169095:353-1303(+)